VGAEKGDDISVKQIKEEQKEILIQELVDNIPDVIYFKDKKGRLILVNKAHAGGLGLVPGQVIGKTDFDFFPLVQAKMMTKDDQKVMQTGKPLLDVIEYTTQPNGSQHIVSTTKIPRKNPKGKIVGIMGITRDITERVLEEKSRIQEQIRISEELRKVKFKLEFEKKKLLQLLNIEEELNKISKKEELSQFVVDRASTLLEAKRCSMMLCSQDQKELKIVSNRGIALNKLEHPYRAKKNSITHYNCQMGNPVLITDIESDPRFSRRNKKYYESKSFVSVPIKSEDEIIGLIHVTDKNANGHSVFTELDLKVLTMLARQVAIALENIKLYKQLKCLTISDPMTNMFNYRHYAKSLDKEINRLKRYGGDLCLLMIDVDNFKIYNDTFGHLEGDNFLRKISHTLHNHLRENDIACRYAGDEFVVILPATVFENAAIVAQHLLKKINGIATKKKMSVSIGVAQYVDDMDRHRLTLNADAALYQAKRNGKNTICCFRKKIIK